MNECCNIIHLCLGKDGDASVCLAKHRQVGQLKAEG